MKNENCEERHPKTAIYRPNRRLWPKNLHELIFHLAVETKKVVEKKTVDIELAKKVCDKEKIIRGDQRKFSNPARADDFFVKFDDFCKFYNDKRSFLKLIDAILPLEIIKYYLKIHLPSYHSNLRHWIFNEKFLCYPYDFFLVPGFFANPILTFSCWEFDKFWWFVDCCVVAKKLTFFILDWRIIFGKGTIFSGKFVRSIYFVLFENSCYFWILKSTQYKSFGSDSIWELTQISIWILKLGCNRSNVMRGIENIRFHIIFSSKIVIRPVTILFIQ